LPRFQPLRRYALAADQGGPRDFIRDGRRCRSNWKRYNIRPLGGAHHVRGGAVDRKERQLLLTLAPEQVSPNLKQHPGLRAGSGYGLIARRKWQDYPTHGFRHPKTRFRCQEHLTPARRIPVYLCYFMGRPVRNGRSDGTARATRQRRHGTEGRTVRQGRHGRLSNGSLHIGAPPAGFGRQSELNSRSGAESTKIEGQMRNCSCTGHRARDDHQSSGTAARLAPHEKQQEKKPQNK
jgi:hypothetical protein